MRPTIVSFNGLSINDGTNYNASIEKGGFFAQAASQSVELTRSDNAPVISTVKRQSKIMKLNIYPLGTFTTQVNALHGYLDPNDKSTRKFVIKDESNVQWYVMAKVEGEPVADVGYVQFTLRIPDSVWRLVTPVTDSWSITGTGQTHTINTTGNRAVYPIFSIQPTGGKTGAAIRHEYRVWYNPSTTDALKDEILDIANKAWNTSTLISDTTVSNQVNAGAGINASVLTIPIDTSVGGGLATTGGLCYCGAEQILYTSISGGNMTVPAGGRGVGGTTAASHADNAVITQSYMYADGRDIRVKLLGDGAGAYVPYYLQGMNTSTTQLWTVPDFDTGIILTLGTALNNSSAVTTMQFEKTYNNKKMLLRMKTKSTFIFAIDSEIFVFNNPASTGDTAGTNGVSIDVANCTITTTNTDARGKFSSTKATHSLSANVYWCQYVWQIAYGNTNLAAQVQDDSQKPIIDLTSTNGTYSWATNFFDITQARAGDWKYLISSSPGKQSTWYTQAHSLGADTTPIANYVDPSTALGLWLSAFQEGATWRGELGKIDWSWYNAAGFTTVTAVNKLYRYSTDWPAFVGLQVSQDGIKWQNVTGFPEATPAGSKSWTAGATHSSVSLGATFYHIRYIINGSIAGNIPNDVVAAELTSISLVRNSSNIPQLVYNSGSLTTTYHLQGKFMNVGTTDFITVDYVMAINDILTVDCLNKHITHTNVGGHAHAAVDFSSKRNYWLTIEPTAANGGVASGGVLQFDELGSGTSGNITVTTTYYDRLV